MAAREHLAVVADIETGEVVEATIESLSAEVLYLRDVNGGLERDIRGWAHRYAELKREKDREAREHDAWPLIMQLFDYWRKEVGRKRARWTEDRFWLALPHFEHWGAANLAAAIAGLAYDPYTKVQKNGKTKKYNDWETLLKSAGALETYMARRPVGWECPEEFIAMSEESEAK